MPKTVTIQTKTILIKDGTGSILAVYETAVRDLSEAQRQTLGVCLELKPRGEGAAQTFREQVEWATSTKCGAKTRGLEVIECQLSVFALKVRKSYLASLNDLLKLANKTEKEATHGVIDSRYVLIRELLLRFATIALSNEEHRKRSTEPLIQAMQRFVDAIVTLTDLTPEFRYGFSREQTHWMADLSIATQTIARLHAPENAFSTLLTYLGRIKNATQAHIMARCGVKLTPEKLGDEFIEGNYETFLNRKNNRSTQTSLVSTSQPCVSALSLALSDAQERQLQKMRVPEQQAQVYTLFMFLNQTELLYGVVSQLDQVIQASNWVLLLTGKLNFVGLLAHLGAHRDQCDDLLQWNDEDFKAHPATCEALLAANYIWGKKITQPLPIICQQFEQLSSPYYHQLMKAQITENLAALFRDQAILGLQLIQEESQTQDSLNDQNTPQSNRIQVKPSLEGIHLESSDALPTALKRITPAPETTGLPPVLNPTPTLKRSVSMQSPILTSPMEVKKSPSPAPRTDEMPQRNGIIPPETSHPKTQPSHTQTIQAPGGRSKRQMNHKVYFSSTQECFQRIRIPGNGECGYRALKIKRLEAYDLIKEHIDAVRDILKPAVKEVLLQEAFITYLSQRDDVRSSPGLMKALEKDFQRVQVAARNGGGQMFNGTQNNLSRYTDNLNIINYYVDYDVRDRKIDAGWAHPCVLQAIAHIQRFTLHIWIIENDQLVPHPYYPEYHPPGAEESIHLLFVNGNHFDRLEEHSPQHQEEIPMMEAIPEENLIEINLGEGVTNPPPVFSRQSVVKPSFLLTADQWVISVLNTNEKKWGGHGHAVILVEGIQDERLFVGRYEILVKMEHSNHSSSSKSGVFASLNRQGIIRDIGIKEGDSYNHFMCDAQLLSSDKDQTPSDIPHETIVLQKVLNQIKAYWFVGKQLNQMTFNETAFQDIPLEFPAIGELPVLLGSEHIPIIHEIASLCGYQQRDGATFYASCQSRSFKRPMQDAQNMIASIEADQHRTELAWEGKAQFIRFQYFGSQNGKGLLPLFAEAGAGINCAEWCIQKLEQAGIDLEVKSIPNRVAGGSCPLI